jgi:hypothetical protein
MAPAGIEALNTSGPQPDPKGERGATHRNVYDAAQSDRKLIGVLVL